MIYFTRFIYLFTQVSSYFTQVKDLYMEAREKYEGRWKSLENRIILAELSIIKDNHLANIDPVIISFGDDDDDEVPELDSPPRRREETSEEAHGSITEMPAATGEKVIFPRLPPELLPLDFEYPPGNSEEMLTDSQTELSVQSSSEIDITGVSSDLAMEE